MTTPTDDRELRPAGRYEWEQIVRRARLDPVITGSGRTGKNGRATRGGMSGTTFTGIALAWASYGNDKGREIWPGDATVAIDMETTIAAVRQVRQALVRLGLMQMLRRRHGSRGDEYRLTIPTDLLDQVEVLTPAQHKLAANRLREAARGKPRGCSDGPPSDPDSGTPVDHPADDAGTPPDHPETDTDPAVGTPPDHPHDADTAGPGYSGGPPGTASGYSGGTRLGTPVAPHTDHDRTTTATGQSDRDLRTAVTHPREGAAVDEPETDPAIEETTPHRPGRRRANCPDHPGLDAGTRPEDGRPRCPLCRRGAPPSPPPDQDATVIQFRPRTA
ncbi:hypothetical protein ABT336_00320 [Micromonospora sp. NPDC000207]|uniref:hypothetical protein n=1 Tax=Micromonospora sp. NPDC000207 TaxID=3154246 RepID=UPI00332E6555